MNCMERIRHIVTVLAAGMLAAGIAATAQNRTRQEIIDSIANPPLLEAGRILEFRSLVADAGTISEDDKPAACEFVWRNGGDKPVKVTMVTTTCGCAVPEFSREPVKPGGEGRIVVRYHPKGHPGPINRRIMVYTDLSPDIPSAILRLEGHVTPSVMPTFEYPHTMGPLMLKRIEVGISGDRLQVERIECLNAGDRPLSIGAEKGLMPAFVTLSMEPATVGPGGKADIVIRFNPGAVAGTLPERLPLILTGLPLPPSQRTLYVKFR